MVLKLKPSTYFIRKSKETKQEEIINKYRSHYKKSNPEQKILITRSDRSAKVLNALFRDDKNIGIQVETYYQKEIKKTIDSGLIRLNNLEAVANENYHLFNGDAALYDSEGFKYVKVELPVGKVDYHIYGRVLKAIGHQFKLCNPLITVQQLNDYLVHLFTTYVVQLGKKDFAYDINLIETIAQSIFSESIVPVYSKIKVLFNPDYQLTENEKQGLRNKLSGTYKSSKGLDEVEKISEETNLTQQQMADKLNISLRTFTRKLKLLQQLQKEQLLEVA